MWLLTLGYYVLLCILGLTALLAAGWALYRMRGFFLVLGVLLGPLLVGSWMRESSSPVLAAIGAIIVLLYFVLIFLVPFVVAIKDAIKDHCAFKRARKSTTPIGAPE